MKNKILKTIYFVRHGQTNGNVEGFYQDKKTSLSEKGEKQAWFVGERFKKIPAEVIISSDYTRAAQTSDAIQKTTGLEVVSSPLFQELKKPSIVVGKSKKDVETKKIIDEMMAHETEPNWRHSDEETLFDADSRARAALQFLLERPEQKIIVVTHELFLKMLLSAMAEKDSRRAVEFCRSIYLFMIQENTGITVAEFGDDGYGERFMLRVWNDHEHLG